MIFSIDDMITEQAAYLFIKTDILSGREGGNALEYLAKEITPKKTVNFLEYCKEICGTAEAIGDIIKPLQNEKAKAMLRVILYDAIYKAIF